MYAYSPHHLPKKVTKKQPVNHIGSSDEPPIYKIFNTKILNAGVCHSSFRKSAERARSHLTTTNIRENRSIGQNPSYYGDFIYHLLLLFRKSNVTPDKGSEVNYMRRKHIPCTVIEYLITLYWTKTIQSGERCLKFPLLESQGSSLCPVWGIKNMIELVPASGEKPAFCYSSGQLIAYSTFNKFLKAQIKKLGMSDDSWSTHSFRQGGITYLAACGVPEKQIKILGDWKSDCYKQYVHCPWQDNLQIATKLRSFLMKSMY